MKFSATLLLLALVIVASVHAQIQVKPRPPRSAFPPRPERSFGIPRPRDRPFGGAQRDRSLSPTFPRPPKSPSGLRFPHRFRRSINNDGVSWNVDLDRGKPSWNVAGQKNIYENKHGSVHVNAGIGSHRGGRPQGQIGIGGQFRWRG